MRDIDVVDEARFDADPAIVYQAVVDQLSGKIDWWSPHFVSRLRGETPADQVGGKVDMSVHGGPLTPRFTGRTIEVIQDHKLRVEYFEGDFRGEGIWTFELLDDHTLLRFRWHVVPHRRLFRVLSPFVDIGKAHSETMKAGFEGLNRYLRSKNE